MTRQQPDILTARIGTLERLRYLTLLTYADISAVNPTAMTPWRARTVVERVFHGPRAAHS